MKKALLLGTLLGGLAAFAWNTLSWEIVGWHEKTMVHFQNEEEIAAAIATHAAVDGTYILPSPARTAGMTREEKNTAEAAVRKKFAEGPIVVASVRRSGFGSFGRAMTLQGLGLLATAFLLTWLLLQTSRLTYMRRVAFVTITSLAAGVMIELPNWNWLGFSGSYTAVNIVDFTLTWLVAGLVIARVSFSAPQQSPP